MKRMVLLFMVLTFTAPGAFAENSVPSGELTAMEQASGQEALLARSLARAIRSYDALSDYTAVFRKREPSAGGEGEWEEIYLKFEKPFKIFMGWLNSRKQGLQVFYERGKNDGKLAIHKPGLLFGLAPVVYLEQDSPWVREGSASYDIEDAGVGVFLKDFTAAVAKATREKKLKVAPVAGRSAWEVRFPGTQKDPVYFAQRIVVDFDEASGLPLTHELYDWEGRPIGFYEYRDFKPNVGSHDEEFRKRIDPNLFKVYHRVEDNAPAKASNFASTKR